MTTITSAARTLAANLLAREISIKHVQALDLLAAGSGLANRHVLAQHSSLPPIRQVNIKLLTSAATVLAQHDLARRQALIAETSAVLLPAGEEFIDLEEYGLKILPSELAETEKFDAFLSTERGEAFLEYLTKGLYYERYTRYQSDGPLSLAQGNEIAEAVLEAKRNAEPENLEADIERAVEGVFGRGYSFDDYWWHEARNDVERTLHQINAELEDNDLDHLAINIELALNTLEDVIGDRLVDNDDSKASDLLSSFDRCEMLFIFQSDGYVIDELISSNKSWADYADLHVGPELQHALSRLGYSLEEYRLLSGNRNPGDDLKRGLKKRPERLVTPDELQEIVENACAQYFCFALYGVVPVQEVIDLDLDRPFTFQEQAAVATYNPFSGTFMDVIKKMPITVAPKEGRLQSGSEGYSPDSICGFYLPAYHTSIRNVPADAPTALAA